MSEIGVVVLVGHLLLGVAMSLGSTALVSRVRRDPQHRIHGLLAWGTHAAWALLVSGFGAAAQRYAERLEKPVWGCALFCAVAGALSFAHAAAFLRWQERAEARSGGMSERSRGWHYAFFLVLVLLSLAAAWGPIAASDLFRRPYSPVWRTINRTMARLSYTYNPSGGGEAPRFPPWRNPADAGLPYGDIMLRTRDGISLSGWYVPSADGGAASVILAHGLYDSKWTMLRLVPWLHGAGYNVLLFDFRGHGGSDPRPTTIGREERLDVQAALDWLEAEGAADWVAGLGMSLGAAALVQTAAQDTRLDALILDSLFAEWRNVDYAKGFRLPPEWLVPNVPDPIVAIGRLDIPLLIIHGTADNLTHADHARRLFAAANLHKTRLWINDSGHAWSAWTYPDVYQEKALGFLADARLAMAKP